MTLGEQAGAMAVMAESRSEGGTAAGLEAWARREGLYGGPGLDPRDAGDLAVLRWLYRERCSVAAAYGYTGSGLVAAVGAEPVPPLGPQIVTAL